LLAVLGIYRLATNHRVEGLVEILGGILELVSDVLGAFL
jgi:hypothetical protein